MVNFQQRYSLFFYYPLFPFLKNLLLTQAFQNHQLSRFKTVKTEILVHQKKDKRKETFFSCFSMGWVNAYQVDLEIFYFSHALH